MVRFKYFLVFMMLSGSVSKLSSQQKMKDFSNIMRSTSIYEIDAFLIVAHPDDPRRLVLKPRVIKMMKEYIKKAHPADQRVSEFQEKIALLSRRPSTRISFDEMNEIIRQKQIAKYRAELEETKTARAGVQVQQAAFSGGSASFAALDASEQAEFAMLMSTSAAEHKNKTVKILNSLFDNDPTSKESIVMIENKSDCDIIVRIEGVGNTRYRLPVPSKKENSIVVEKGSYLFTSNVCGAKYASQKNIEKAIMVSLDNPGK